MSKKYYIDAVNEIEVRENIKRETINKTKHQNSKLRKYNRIYPLASLAIMCAVIMTIILPNTTIAPITEKHITKYKKQVNYQK